MSNQNNEKSQTEIVKDNYIAFLESLKELKDGPDPDHARFKTLSYEFMNSIEDEELKELVPELNTIHKHAMGSKIRVKSFREAIRSLSDDELRDLSSVICIGIKYVDETPYAGGSTQWERENSNAIKLSAALLEEFSSRI